MAHSSLEALAEHVASLKAAGKRVVFTNGVFDILHVGHVTYLEAAKAKGDILIVGVNDDASVRRLNKGPERPINGEAARAKVISSLKSVDEVVIFGEDTPYEVIQLLKPNVLVKGGDYDPEERNQDAKTYLVGSDLVRAEKGEVAVIPLVEGFSTTSIVRKLKG
ncbi:MAG: D-glycero-beta-D-manno-heptose 1-phosphate adenylyltransferase [Flavobacteriales bacterium]|nr:D-glycero-beta-D-manno-heptose 1-phosphate adenylyltransferase [Flavobacteriales bacterium]